jgi:hypothetical protein
LRLIAARPAAVGVSALPSVTSAQPSLSPHLSPLSLSVETHPSGHVETHPAVRHVSRPIRLSDTFRDPSGHGLECSRIPPCRQRGSSRVRRPRPPRLEALHVLDPQPRRGDSRPFPASRPLATASKKADPRDPLDRRGGKGLRVAELAEYGGCLDRRGSSGPAPLQGGLPASPQASRLRRTSRRRGCC